MKDLIRCLKSEEAATLVEYALVIALIAAAVIGAGKGFGAALYAMYQRIAQTLQAA